MSHPTRLASSLFALLGLCMTLSAQNPYLPMWEFIPDGEPYVFEDPDQPGHYRVYIYGSHDDLVYTYCGRDQVVWSASVDNLTQWRFDGEIFRSERDANGDWLNPDSVADLLYAPDVALRIEKDGTKRYYLYPNNQARGRENMVAVSDRPDGPFTVINWSKEDPKRVSGSLYFDPGVLVDDDGRAYAYWGFQESWGGELEDDMATVLPDSYVQDMIPNLHQEGEHRFFEASSIRKIEDKYVFIYSRMTAPGEFGLPMCNYTLAYAYSDHPLGPFTYGGTLVDGRARGVDADGQPIATACPYGNTHGSLCRIGEQWWLFFHRQTGTDEFSRQAMVAPVTVTVEKGEGGRVLISEAEYTSEGFHTDGLDPLKKTLAGYACYLTNPKGVRQEFPNFFFTGSYISPMHCPLDKASLYEPISYSPVVNNTAGSVVGFKYFRMDELGKTKKVQLCLMLRPEGVNGRIRVLMGKTPYDATEIGCISLTADMPQEMLPMIVDCPAVKGMTGKQALYLVFESETEDASLCSLSYLQFVRGKVKNADKWSHL